jgi:Tol biopolymer transport system component
LENPSWSFDEKFIFWNAYTNGVSNIYRMSLDEGTLRKQSIEAISHTLRGLFKPIYISKDSLFAFEFTSDGLIPVFIPNKPAGNLPAIHY